MPPSSPPIVLVVSHTHWDREWYHEAAAFRVALVTLIDELLDDPLTGAAAFLLDGQTILLDDYLAVRPERQADLAAALARREIEAGPWYVLADGLIPSGEALVRNLLAGRDSLRRLHATAPPVLYSPDAFGHPAILPELAAGFGCSLIVLWRGAGGAAFPRADLLAWEGPTGATALTYHLPPSGYEIGSSLPLDVDAATERWDRLRGPLLDRNSTGVALLLNGADHHARQRHLPQALAVLGRAASPVHIVPASLAAVATALTEAAPLHALPRIRGELRNSYGYTWTLQGTFATRAAQKRRNACAERTLLRDVEPWSAQCRRASLRDDAALLRAAWRDLLAVHPHDTLCGTSTDGVARAADARLDSVLSAAAVLEQRACDTLVGHDTEAARVSHGAWSPAILIRNPAARVRSGIAELRFSRFRRHVPVGPGTSALPVSATLSDDDAIPQGVQLLAREIQVELTESPRHYPDADEVEEITGLVAVSSVPGFAIGLLDDYSVHDGLRAAPVSISDEVMDNGRVRVSIDSAGVISLLDQGSGWSINQVISFERASDMGDSYTPSIRHALPPPTLEVVEARHRGPLRASIAMRYSWPSHAAESHDVLELRVSLDAGSDCPVFELSGESHSHDHRLRIVFHTGLPTGTVLADAAFLSATRETPVAPAHSAEAVIASAPLHRWVTRWSQDRGVTVLSDGLAEYEVLPDGAIAVTLVRGIGELSRADLPERPGHAGWPVPVPEAQSMGPFCARFSVLLHGADSDAERMRIEHAAEDFLHPLQGKTVRSWLPHAIEPHGVELTGAGLAFSALLPATRAGHVVLRCRNLSRIPTSGSWGSPRPFADAWLARLDEEPLVPLTITHGVIHFAAQPQEIVTIIAR